MSPHLDLARPVWGRNFDLPSLVYRGPEQFSTETDLVPISCLPCWDVNRYYRDLGLAHPYTNASRGDVRKAYLAVDGSNDHRKTFVFKQLLNRETKAAYDRWPLGPVPFWDSYVEAEIKMAAMAEMHRRGMGQEDTDLLKEVFREFGAVMDEPDEDDLASPVDNSNAKPDDHDDPAREIPPYPFSFYLWRTSYQNVERLAQWQEMLIRAFAARRIKTRLTLGYVGSTPHRWLTGKVGYRDVVYLNRDTEPDIQVADDIAARMQEMQETSIETDALCLTRL